MSISIALTEDQRSLLQLSLEIARDKFKENASYLLSNGTAERLVDQFRKQAKEADALLLWIAGAEAVII